MREKITVKGVVTRHDLSDPDNQLLYLGHGICCNFGDNQSMAESYRIGTIVYIDGILKRCLPDDVLLEPAMGRDPTASFKPMQ